MKRRFLVFLSVLFTLITTIALVSACRPDDGGSQEAGAEIGEYYCEYNGTEYSLTLSEGKAFAMTIANDTLTGNYTLDGEALTLNANSQGEIAATYRGNEITLTYQETAYRFLKKVEFTVHFATGEGTTVADQKVINGKTATKPEDPKYGEKVFVGWYTDNNTFRNLYYFSQPVTGDITLYARYVDMIDPEFKVTFDAGEGAAAIAPQTTAGHKLFDLPTPVRSDGAEFVGWYVSQFYNGEKLSYLYEAETTINENLTLYAVWDEGKPLFTVAADGIRVLNAGVNTRYTFSIKAPGATDPETGSDTAAFHAYNFASKEKGEYEITVTINDESTTLYYNNKALARVSVFEVEESTIFFNEVPNAERYLLTVICGTEGHTHTEIEVENRSWSFANCEMPDTGILFSVKAEADGYVTSESEVYPFTRTLDKVENLDIDEATENITWNAVEKAASYYVTVKKAGEEAAVYAEDIGNRTSFSLKTFAEGDYTVEVKALARGWKASAAASVTYQKTRLATPADLRLTGETLTWTAVTGAEQYIITIGGTEHIVENAACTYSLAGLDIDTTAGPVEVTIRATAANKTDSLESDPIALRAELGELTYEAGQLSWEAVIGIEEYTVTVNDNEPVTVQNNTYKVTFDREGVNTLKVSILNAQGEVLSEKTTTVTAYKISFEAEMDSYTEEIPSQYYADGDPLALPEPELYGYTFESWYTAPGGSAGEGELYDDTYFQDGQNRTLYATWYGNEHTITFNIGSYGKEEVQSVKVRFGETTTLPVAVSRVDTHAFSGWHYDSEGGVELADFKGVMARAFARDEDITVYASYVEVFTFKTESEVVTVSKGPGITQGIVTEVRIPEKYNGAVVGRLSDFSNCTKLEIIHIPDSISTILIGDTGAAFAGDTALREIDVYETNGEIEAKWTSSEGVLIAIDPNTSMKTLWYYPIGKTGVYTVPDDVTAINNGAINGANGLTKLIIGTSVAEIKQNAIMDCDGLLSIEFVSGGSGDLDIRPGAFQDCNALEEIKLPARLVANFDPDSLAKLKALKTITVEEGGDYSVVDGLLCKTYTEGTTSGKEIVFAPKGLEFGDYTIPSGIVSIGEKAFYEHPSLTGITIPGYVEKIKTQAFGHITVLASITFQGIENDPDLTIDAEAFYGGYESSSGSDTGSNSQVTTLHLPANLVSMGANAFGRYSKLTEVWVEADREMIDYRDGAFISKKNNTSYVTTIHIGAKCPDFSFPDVFGKLLSSVDVEEGNPYMKEEEGVIYNTAETAILFYPNEKAGAYVIPDTVTSIGNGTFTNRKQLTAITIPAAVESIGDNAFEGCSALETVTFLAPEEGVEAKPLTIGNSAFNQCTELRETTLPDRLIKLGKSAFINCDGLTSINLPKDLAEIVVNTDRIDIFDNCDNLTTITVDPDNVYFTAKQGVLYRTAELQDSTYVPYEAMYCLPGAEGQITVPGTVHHVLKYAFRYIPNVTKITFENTQALTLKADEQVIAATDVTFEPYALYGYIYTDGQGLYNENLKEVVLPEGLTQIGATSAPTSATYGPILSFHGLTKITIPSTVEAIYPNAFDGCTVLNELVFAKTPEGVEEAPLAFEDGYSYSAGTYGTTYYGAFGKYYASGSNVTDDMFKITNLVLPARTVKIGAYALYHAPVKSLTFESAPKSLVIGDNAFSYCTFETFALPEGTTTIGNRVFTYTTLPTMNLPDSITAIGDYAFADTNFASGEDTLVLPKSLQTLGAYAFGDQFNAIYPFTKVDFTKATGLTSIGHHAFANHKTLSSVTFAVATAESPELSIGAYAFQNDRDLGSITLPANVTKLGESVADGSQTYEGSVFYGCSGLETITFATYDVEGAQKSRLSYIGSKTFGNTGITSITFPESTATELVVGEQLFVFCSSLTEVTFSTSIHALNNMFKGCGSITKVVIPEGSEHFLADESKPILYNRDGTVVQYVYSAMTGDFEIGNGSGIEANAFYGQTEITKIVIPAGVQEIGDYAFANCVSLQTVEFVNGSQLTTIGDNAFENCWALESINLEACTQLETLGTGTVDIKYHYTYVFRYDTALKSLTFNSKSLTTIGQYAFAYSGITEIDLSACSGYTTIANNAFRNMSSLQSVKLPGMTTANDFSTTTVTTMGEYAFASAPFTSLTLKAGVTYGKGAFQTCTQLQQVTFSNGNASFELPEAMFSGCSALDTLNFTDLTGLTKIGKETFKGCAFTSVDLSKCTSGAAATMMAQQGSFQNCASLTSITLPAQVTKFGNYMFSGTGFTSVDLADFAQITSWGSYMFQNCKSLTSVNIPADAATPGANMFDGCSELSSVTFEEGYSKTISNYMFRSCTSLETIDLSKTKITTFGTYAFQKCTALESADLTGATAKALGDYMFDGCSELSEVKLPDSINHAGKYTFQNCTSLRSIDFSKTAITRFTGGATTNATSGSSGTKIYTFAGCENLETVKLPEGGISQVGVAVFLNCKSLTSIDLSNVVKFGYQAFMGSGLTGEIKLSGAITTFGDTDQVFANCPNITAFTGADSGTTIKTQNGMIVNAKNDTIIAVPGNMSVSDETLKLTGDSPIGSYAFNGFAAKGVTTLDLSGMTVTSLPNYAFYGSSFEEIILPNTVTSIGNYAFANCANLTTVQLSTALTTLGTYLFQNCTSLTGVEFPESITALPNYVFDGDTAMTTYDFPEHITEIGQYAFRNTGLTSLTIPTHITTLGQYAFAGSAVESVVFQGDPTMGTYMFQNCPNLTTVDFGPRTSIAEREFNGAGLKEITISANITQIGKSAFFGSALQSVKFEGNPIGNDPGGATALFQGCTELTDVTLPEGLLVIPQSMFNKCTALRTIHIPDTVTDIGYSAFEGCSNLTTVNIPRDIKNIGRTTFSGCSSLEGDIVLPKGVTFQYVSLTGSPSTVNQNVFTNCTSLNSITLSASVAAQTLDSTVFSGLTENQTIRFYESRYEVIAVCGIAWLRNTKATVVYNYTGEEA